MSYPPAEKTNSYSQEVIVLCHILPQRKPVGKHHGLDQSGLVKKDDAALPENSTTESTEGEGKTTFRKLRKIGVDQNSIRNAFC